MFQCPNYLSVKLSYGTLVWELPEASLEYWRERKELLSLEMAVGISGCDTVLSRLPLVKPHRSQRDRRSPSTPLEGKMNLFNESNMFFIIYSDEGFEFYLLLFLILGWT